MNDKIKNFNKTRLELLELMEYCFDNPTKKEWVGADVVEAFSSYGGNFKEDNWNDGRISLFRQLMYELPYNLIYIGEYQIIKTWFDDTTYINILNRDLNDMYYVEWYKSRGATDKFLYDGLPIHISVFKDLLKDLLTLEIVEVID